MRLSHAAFFFPLALLAADEFAIWPDGAPGSEGRSGAESVRTAPNGERVVSNIHNPTLTPYLPEKSKATGTAVIVIPGGGHRELWSDHEGHNVARWLAERGVAGFVLKHRLSREKGSTYAIEKESLADTQQAIRVLRARAADFSLNPANLGVMGFSAGGELAALASLRYAASADDVKPAFQALIYPAIPRDATLAKDMPPAFLVCGENDRQNISQGLPELYLAMKRAGMSAELHVYAGVGHGFGFRATTQGPVAQWPQRFLEWLGTRGLLRP
ncbi:MAG: alpha/beta hydrolase [Bryobacterales bacterium]|nr:alpha/beta hydrolase [Bryobacterales bacterium]